MKLITLNQVRNLTELSKTSIYKLMRTGRFPLHIKVGNRSSRWVESEIIEWSRTKRLETLLLDSPYTTDSRKIIDEVFN
ncbi:TPA: AlpA family phage regulatory protein [Vibrio parahaemolyticus]|nr:AlpA family phage regulatory protein [Vibrio parahaemolyticus]